MGHYRRKEIGRQRHQGSIAKEMKGVTQAIGDGENTCGPTKKAISLARKDEAESAETLAEAFH